MTYNCQILGPQFNPNNDFFSPELTVDGTGTWEQAETILQAKFAQLKVTLMGCLIISRPEVIPLMHRTNNRIYQAL